MTDSPRGTEQTLGWSPKCCLCWHQGNSYNWSQQQTWSESLTHKKNQSKRRQEKIKGELRIVRQMGDKQGGSRPTQPATERLGKHWKEGAATLDLKRRPRLYNICKKSTYVYIVFINYDYFLFWDRVSLCNPDWPQTYFLSGWSWMCDLPASVLKLQTCTTTLCIRNAL